MQTTVEIKIDNDNNSDELVYELCDDIGFYPDSIENNATQFQVESECIGIYDTLNEVSMIILAFRRNEVQTNKKKKTTSYFCHYFDIENCVMHILTIKVNDEFTMEFKELSKNYRIINNLHVIVS